MIIPLHLPFSIFMLPKAQFLKEINGRLPPIFLFSEGRWHCSTCFYHFRIGYIGDYAVGYEPVSEGAD